MTGAQTSRLIDYLEEHSADILPVVDFSKANDQLCHFDFSQANIELSEMILENTAVFATWVSEKLTHNHCRYGIGGYKEHRTIYSRSALFDTGEEPRRFHLGVDIWGPIGTEIFAPLSGKIHSFKFNNNFGDYGATLVVEHEGEGFVFHSLYGHLSLNSIAHCQAGAIVVKGQKIGEFGNILENGHWPPHLHFQLIHDMQGWYGNYPGVCKYSERESYLNNCPDPNIILKHTFEY